MLLSAQNTSRDEGCQGKNQDAPELLEDVDEEELVVATVQYT